MGIERTVTLWYLHRQMLLQELASLEAQLIHMCATSEHEAVQPQAENETVEVSFAPAVTFSEEASGASPVEIEKQYKRVQERLRNLGPCPRPMMG
jgi:hypothetical protein